MALHDAYARFTPFEIAFPDRARMADLAGAVADEAAERGVDASALDGFVGLACVGGFLAELHGEAPRASLLEYGTLVFHAVHFLGAGSPVFLLETPTARRLVEGAPWAAPEAPAPAGYLQLPQHLFWTRLEGAAESVDGMFWTISAAERLHVLPITGVRSDRPGFGTLSVPDAPMSHAAEWLEATVRKGGDDYASDLPGAQLDRLYAIESVGEILKLMARVFAHAARAARAPASVHAPEAASGAGPRPSALPYTRIGAGE